MIDLAPTPPLTGTISLPGDRLLTLNRLVLGMLSPATITIQHASSDPSVDDLCRFFASHGATWERQGTSLVFTGAGWHGAIVIPRAVPDAVIPHLIASIVFSGCDAVIIGGNASRATVIGHLPPLLRELGLPPDRLIVESEDITIGGAAFRPAGAIHARTPWILETVLAASLAANRPVIVSYPISACSAVLRMAVLAGAIIEQDSSGDPETALNRRLARANGAKPADTRVISWTGEPSPVITLPGDTTLAAALCGAAVLIQRSRITIEGVLWEQGRRGFFDALGRMKAQVVWRPAEDTSFAAATLTASWGKLEGLHLTADQSLTMPSEGLLLGAVAALASGRSIISMHPELPAGDREAFALLARGLERLGARTGNFPEGLVVQGALELHGTSLTTGGIQETGLALALTALAAAGPSVLTDADPDSYLVREFRASIRALTAELPLAL